MLGILTPTFAKISLVSAILIGIGLYANNWHNAKVDEAVTSAKNTILVEQQKQTIRLLARQHEVNTELMTALDERKRKYAKDVDNLNRSHATAIAGLRNRPSRSSDKKDTIVTDTCNREATTGCYPSQLYREDAELAINYSRDAEQVRLALLKCYGDYDEVKNKIELLGKD